MLVHRSLPAERRLLRVAYWRRLYSARRLRLVTPPETLAYSSHAEISLYILSDSTELSSVGKRLQMTPNEPGGVR
jgi:hypothetical protein